MSKITDKITPKAIAIVAIIALSYMVYSWYTPIALDDYLFARYYLDVNGNSSDFSFRAFADYILSVRMNENGRLANYLCAPIVLWMPHWLWSITISFLITSTIVISAVLSSGKRRLSARMLIFVWGLSVIFLPWQDYSGLSVIDYALNYFLSWFLVLVTIICLIRVERSSVSHSRFFIMAVGAFFTGMVHESFSFALIATLFVIAVSKKFRLSEQWWGLFSALVVGELLCVTAPGIISRFGGAGGGKLHNLIYFVMFVKNTKLFFTAVFLTGTAMLFTKSGRRHLTSIFKDSVNRYCALCAAFAMLIHIIVFAPVRFSLASVAPTIILFTGALRSQTKFFAHFNRLFSAISLSLIMLFYGVLCYWQKQIFEEHEVLLQKIKKANGKIVYAETIRFAPWYTFSYVLDGLWFDGAQSDFLADYLKLERDRFFVLPESFENKSLSECSRIKIDGRGYYYQYEDFVFVESNYDIYLLPKHLTITMADGKTRGTQMTWHIYLDKDNRGWFIGIPEKKEIKGPFRRIAVGY